MTNQWRRIDREAADWPHDWQDKSWDELRALPSRKLETWWLFPEGLTNPWNWDALATVGVHGDGTWSASVIDGDQEEEGGDGFRSFEEARKFVEVQLRLDGVVWDPA